MKYISHSAFENQTTKWIENEQYDRKGRFFIFDKKRINVFYCEMNNNDSSSVRQMMMTVVCVML